eukprot:m.482245 g.482245  ORF g.482245 m.482245 type:complete len:80 (+) comp22478_c0_seq1:1393-1632(+)
MTKATRSDNGKKIGCFPHETLLDALSRLLDEDDGEPTSMTIIGKRYFPGDMEKPVSKFHGREVEIATDKLTFRIAISEA